MATDPAQASRRRDAVTGVRNVGDTTETEAPHQYRAGDLIDKKFRLVRRVGAGGMGTVWVAHNQVLDVQVGIKLITFRGSKNREALARRLLDEARSAARLGHPAVIKIHDFGVTDQGDPFIAMELLSGEDLAALLGRQKKIAADDAIQMLLPIAHGLAAAHDKGIVHRDIKPENIYLARDDDGELRPKLLDFGIARMIDSPTKLTLEGVPLGTPEYMSPELARGEVAEAASDIWSFTVLLYEVLTGVCPFQAPNYNRLMQAILHEEPEPLQAHGDFEPELCDIVLKGLAKDVARRWHSMRELGGALARLLLARGITEDISGASLRRTWGAPGEGGVTETSTLSRLAVDSGCTTAQAPPPSHKSAPDTDEYQLAAIAEMNRGGDPVDLLTRAETRRMSLLVAFVVVMCFGLVGSILIGTGIIGFG